MTGAPGDEPWRRSTSEVAAAMRTDPDAGLSRTEAAQRPSQYGPNRLDEERRRPAWLKFLDQFPNPTLAALDLALAGGLLGGSGKVDEARTMAFTTLVLAQLVNCFNARPDRTSAFRGLFTNGWLWAGSCRALAPPPGRGGRAPVPQRRVRHDALRAEDWLLCAGLASVVLWTNEARKLAAHWSANGRRDV